METHPAAGIKLGAGAERQVIVTAELTVQYAYPSLPAGYATPQMIYLMELAAADAIAPLLPAGWGSVGTLVDVRHLAATPVGCTVSAQAEVIEVNGCIVRFAVCGLRFALKMAQSQLAKDSMNAH